ncbi:hypothetical protein BU15DRAFT_66372 [Melanogaster broomeanus]|nr:hypothetical protein BU15DRAFT_66372 [Melanogaster broomeanus]
MLSRSVETCGHLSGLSGLSRGYSRLVLLGVSCGKAHLGFYEKADGLPRQSRIWSICRRAVRYCIILLEQVLGQLLIPQESPFYSTSTSPAFSALLPTPQCMQDHTTKIVSASSSPGSLKWSQCHSQSLSPKQNVHVRLTQCKGCTTWDNGEAQRFGRTRMAKETIAKGLSEDTVDETTDDQGDHERDSTPLSMTLKGECDAQRRTNGARTGQQHGAIAHSQGPSAWAERHASCTTSSSSRVPDRIIDDPGRCVKPSLSDRTPAAEAASIPAPPSMLLKGEQGSRRTSGCANDEVHTRSGTKAKDDVASHQDHCRYIDRPRDDIPEPCTSPTKRPKRPIQPANPPCRRGRLKTRHPRVNQARVYEETRTHAAATRNMVALGKLGPPDPSDTHWRCWGSIVGQLKPRTTDSELVT